MKLAVSLWLVGLGLIAVCKADDLLREILAALAKAVDCPSCHDLLVPVQKLARLGDGDFVETFAAICRILKLEDDDVCAGSTREQGPILAHALRSFDVRSETATKFCISAFGLCPSPPVTPFKVPFPKPPPTYPKKFITTRKPPFQVVHFSDVHIDRQYTVGADADCNKNICCRKFADHRGPVIDPAGPFGNHKCDSPPDLADSMLDAIGQFGSKAKFSIFTGDVVEGDTWIVNTSEATLDLKGWNAQMAAKVRSPVYPSLGNHDTAPAASFIPDNAKTTMSSQWVFDIQSAGWEQWINATAAKEAKHTSGSYAVVVPDTNLRIISVNTQYWYRQNFWIYSGNTLATDPNGILAFMVSQLQAAEDAGQRAWIIGHIPLGKADTFRDQSNYYDQIVHRYINTVAGQFFGHSHKDQFEISYSDWNNQTADTADNIALIAPALTPTSGNPAFKLYDIDPDTYEVLDAKVYMTNVSDPNFQAEPTWELYYSARDSYGPLVGELGPKDPLNGSFWHKLTEVFEKNDTAFQLWNTRISRGGAVTACTGDCKNVTICDQRALRSENNCDVASGGISFFKRDVPLRKQEHLECEGGGFAIMFRGLLSGSLTGELGPSADVKARIREVISTREKRKV